MFLYNPEDSGKGFNIVYTFKMSNLSIQGQERSNFVVNIENLMPGDCRLIRFEAIDQRAKKEVSWTFTFEFI